MRFLDFNQPDGWQQVGSPWAKAYFEPSDPFQNRLALLLAKSGDDWSCTAYYGGLPCLIVWAGDTLDDASQYEWEIPEYATDGSQEIHALFFENVIGSLPIEGEDTCGNEIWPFPHSASNMVHEQVKDGAPGQLYNLYHDLIPEAPGEGHELVAFVGIMAQAMYDVLSERLPDPAKVGF